jgi:hypothetical protein
MKKIIITEDQAKMLVDNVIVEQETTTTQASQEEPTKSDTAENYQMYQINSKRYFTVNRGAQLFTAEYDESEGAWVPKVELSTEPTFTLVSDGDNLDIDLLMGLSNGSYDPDIKSYDANGNQVEGQVRQIVDPKTKASMDQGRFQSMSRSGRQPMQTAGVPDSITRGLGIVTIGKSGVSEELVPVYLTIFVMKTNKPPQGLEVINPEAGAKLVYGKTAIKGNKKMYFWLKIGPGIEGQGVSNETDNDTKDGESWYCVTYQNGERKVQSYKFNTRKEKAPQGKEFVGTAGIAECTGPYNNSEEAKQNCQVVKLPSVIPFNKYFPNNISQIKLKSSDEGVKTLSEFFKAGGKLKSFQIVSSASMVPAGSVEGDSAKGKWVDNHRYDNSVEGTNDDKTGNLQLTKARAYNLYIELITLFPELKGIPHTLVAEGSTGDPYNPKSDHADDAKYGQFRRVNFLPNK